jgi:hypothetical protein
LTRVWWGFGKLTVWWSGELEEQRQELEEQGLGVVVWPVWQTRFAEAEL